MNEILSCKGPSYHFRNNNIHETKLRTKRIYFLGRKIQNLLPIEFIEFEILKKVFLQISQNSQENTCARVSFLIKFQKKKETLAQIFSCEFCEISKSIFSTEHLQTTTSDFNIYGNNYLKIFFCILRNENKKCQELHCMLIYFLIYLFIDVLIFIRGHVYVYAYPIYLSIYLSILSIYIYIYACKSLN